MSSADHQPPRSEPMPVTDSANATPPLPTKFAAGVPRHDDDDDQVMLPPPAAADSAGNPPAPSDEPASKPAAPTACCQNGLFAAHILITLVAIVSSIFISWILHDNRQQEKRDNARASGGNPGATRAVKAGAGVSLAVMLSVFLACAAAVAFLRADRQLRALLETPASTSADNGAAVAAVSSRRRITARIYMCLFYFSILPIAVLVIGLIVFYGILGLGFVVIPFGIYFGVSVPVVRWAHRVGAPECCCASCGQDDLAYATGTDNNNAL